MPPSGGGSEPAEVTLQLTRWGEGDLQAGDRVFDLLYDDLRGLARGVLADQRRAGAIEATALVNELYLRLAVHHFRPAHDDRVHFLGAAAVVMRRIVIDHGRERDARRRGGGARIVTLERAMAQRPAPSTDALAVDEALARLEREDARLAEVVELRFFAGFAVEETAALLGVSPRTVKRDWQRARRLLAARLAPAMPA